MGPLHRHSSLQGHPWGAEQRDACWPPTEPQAGLARAQALLSPRTGPPQTGAGAVATMPAGKRPAAHLTGPFMRGGRAAPGPGGRQTRCKVRREPGQKGRRSCPCSGHLWANRPSVKPPGQQVRGTQSAFKYVHNSEYTDTYKPSFGGKQDRQAKMETGRGKNCKAAPNNANSIQLSQGFSEKLQPRPGAGSG